AAAKDVLAKVARRARFLERLLEALVLVPDLAVDVVVADRGAAGVPADDHPLDEDVRVVADDVAVLERARLALVGIADDVLLAGERLRHEAPLEARREACASAPTQRRLLHLCDDLVGRHL